MARQRLHARWKRSTAVDACQVDKSLGQRDRAAPLFRRLDDGVKDYAPWAMFVILVVAALLSFTTIFMFKKRMLQIRLTIFNTIVLVGYYLVLAYFVVNPDKAFDDYSFMPSWTVCLPLVSIILNWLAIRAIGKDEMLVKAYERLR